MRLVGYIRTSTSDQHNGLDAQEDVIREHCRARGWTIAGIERDQASGKTTNGRPGLERALAACRSGLTDGIIASKVDRLSRSVVDFGRLLEDARRHDFNVVCLDLGVDLSTPQGELIANVLASVAQWERKVIAERTRQALAVVKARGTKLGNPNLKSASDAAIARIIQLRAQGLNLEAIARVLNAEHVPTAQNGARWHGSTIGRILKRQTAQ
jgi:DNA invertase Pin-like site-specific DNA recombinase